MLGPNTANAVRSRRSDDALQHLARVLLDRLTVHDEITGDPGHLGLPGKLDQRVLLRIN